MRALPRSTRRELLDGDGLAPSELRRNLREMARLNRLPGGIGASVTAVRRVLGDRHGGRVLDVGPGAGDFARRLHRVSSVPLTLVDNSAAVLGVARHATASIPDVELVLGDARTLPLADEAVTCAHASLLVHHLDPADVAPALREMRRVATHGVVVNDLRRSWPALLVTAAAVRTLAQSPVTRHDGILSARRAYTLAELDDLAAEAGLRPVARTPAWWPRVTTTYR